MVVVVPFFAHTCRNIGKGAWAIAVSLGCTAFPTDLKLRKVGLNEKNVFCVLHPFSTRFHV